MSLTLHCDASDTGHIFTTYDVGGVHTGTPTDGSAVQVWDDEGDGVSDVILQASSTVAPLWRSTTPLMLLPCLDFDGTNDAFLSYVQTGSSGGTKAISNFITASACTVLIAFYAESITSTSATPYDDHCLIGDNSGYWGVFLRNLSGQRKAMFYNYDGSEDTFELDISENTNYVLMFRHASGNLYGSLNGGTESSPVASGNTQVLTAPLRLGNMSLSTFYNGRIGEFKIWNTGDADSNLAAEIATMVTKWVTGSTSNPISLSGSLTGAGGLVRSVRKPFAGVI